MNFNEGVVFSAIKKSIPFSPIILSILGELPVPGSTGKASTAFALANIEDMLI